MSSPQQELSFAFFSSRLRGSFQIRDFPDVALELVEVEPFGSVAPDQHQGFSLIFRGPPLPMLAQQIHVLEPDDGGALEIFLVPLGCDQAGARYQAVFN